MRPERTNFRFYEARCSHGSSLSRAMHGLVAARLGYSEMALDHFRQAATIDLSDSHVAIDGGVHIAALGGTWLTAVFGFAGLSLQNDCVRHQPSIHNCRMRWLSLSFGIQWRSHSLRIRIDQTKQRVEATLEAGEPMTLFVSGEPHDLRGDRTLRVSTERPNGPQPPDQSSTQPAC